MSAPWPADRRQDRFAWLDDRLYRGITAVVKDEVRHLGSQVLLARDNRVRELERQVEQHKDEVRQLGIQVEARDNQVHELEQQKQESNNQVQHLGSRVRELEHQVRELEHQKREADQEKEKYYFVIVQTIMMFSGYSGPILDFRVYGKDTFALTGDVVVNGANGNLWRGLYVCHDHKEDRTRRIVHSGVIKTCWSEPALWQSYQKIVIKTAKATGLESFKREQAVNKRLMENNVKGVPLSQYYDDEKVLVMEDCGQNFEEYFETVYKYKSPLKLGKVCKYGLMILAIIGDIHNLGILHMDLKPANLTMKYSKVYIIDFGEALRNVNGNVRHGWHGTYRSVNLSRTNREIGKVDDLWSVYFILVSLIHPSIIAHWKDIKSADRDGGKEKQLDAKKRFIDDNKDKCTILQLLADEGKTHEEKFVGFKEHLNSEEGVFQFA